MADRCTSPLGIVPLSASRPRPIASSQLRRENSEGICPLIRVPSMSMAMSVVSCATSVGSVPLRRLLYATIPALHTRVRLCQTCGRGVYLLVRLPHSLGSVPLRCLFERLIAKIDLRPDIPEGIVPLMRVPSIVPAISDVRVDMV